MINPHLFRPAYKKFAPMHRPKRYQAVIAFRERAFGEAHYICRAPNSPDGMFKTATEAALRAQSVHARWVRLYNAAVLAMVRETPNFRKVTEQAVRAME